MVLLMRTSERPPKEKVWGLGSLDQTKQNGVSLFFDIEEED